MKVAAVIAEYNPFHTGHQYQLEQIRKEHHADFIIVIMSGDFVQRGAPAIMDKYIRSQMALSCGADLVLELPVTYALGSAEYFAHGAVSLLNALGVVDILHFGSECGDIHTLTSLAELYVKQPVQYQESLTTLLKNGLPFPLARTMATLKHFEHINDKTISEESLEAILSSPNNVLGIEYCKAINRLDSAIKPATIQRLGADYHEQHIDHEKIYPSATGIRNLLIHNQSSEQLTGLLPEKAFKIYMEKQPVLLTENDFSAVLHYKLLSQRNRDYTEYLDVNSDLSNKIAKTLQQFTTFQNYCMLLKSKNYTYTRICRCMFHILLNIYQKDVAISPEVQMPQYVRMLGFRKDAMPLLSEIKQKSSITLLSKLANYKKVLTPEDQRKLELDLNAYDVYQSIITSKCGIASISEFTRQNVPVL